MSDKFKMPECRPVRPFDKLSCDFLFSLADILWRHDFPNVIAFARWCGMSRILQERRLFYDRVGDYLGRGLAFHIPPGNIPIVLAFSFAFGLLAGCSNVVRIPGENSLEMDIIISSVEELFLKEEYSRIKETNTFVKYEKVVGDEITRTLSSVCDARIIWGSNETISYIRTIPIPAHAVELTFCNRYSACIINSDAILNEDLYIEGLARHFCHDTYTYNQAACSSPKLIIWVGDRIESAQEKFWIAVEEVLDDIYSMTEKQVVDKYYQVCSKAINRNLKYFSNYGNAVYCVGVKELDSGIADLFYHSGFFLEYEAESLDAVPWKFFDRKCQTLSCFGFDRSVIAEFVIRNNLLGIDRIVPIGAALQMDSTWDGYDIIRSLSREIVWR